MIKKVSSEMMNKIIETRKPYGRFFYRAGNVFVACDNERGDAWVEEFSTLAQCITWLGGCRVMVDLNHVFDWIYRNHDFVEPFKVYLRMKKNQDFIKTVISKGFERHIVDVKISIKDREAVVYVDDTLNTHIWDYTRSLTMRNMLAFKMD